MTTEERADYDLMRHLLALHNAHDEANDSTARGKLANLRYAMRDRLHADFPVGRVFPAIAPVSARDTAERMTDDKERNEWRTVIAGLFGYAHDDVEDTEYVSLGAALRTLYDRRETDSMERRFMALLNADAEHLPGHLRQAISLLKAEKIGLDWGMLLRNVSRWDNTGKPIQKKWVNDYYRSRKNESAESPVAEDTDTDEQSE